MTVMVSNDIKWYQITIQTGGFCASQTQESTPVSLTVWKNKIA